MTSRRSASIPEQLTKREVAEIAIRNAIEAGLYKPGQIISQRQIAEDLDLSITPIREAILVMMGNGIVDRHKHHSIKVKEIDEKRLREIFSVRQILEEQAVRLTAEFATPELIRTLGKLNDQLALMRADDDASLVNPIDREFHNTVFSSCGNTALVWTIDRLKSSFPLYALWSEPGRLEKSISEHQRLIEALEKRDSKAAASVQVEHLSNGLDDLLSFLARENE